MRMPLRSLPATLLAHVGLCLSLAAGAPAQTASVLSPEYRDMVKLYVAVVQVEERAHLRGL